MCYFVGRKNVIFLYLAFVSLEKFFHAECLKNSIFELLLRYMFLNVIFVYSFEFLSYLLFAFALFLWIIKLICMMNVFTSKSLFDIRLQFSIKNVHRIFLSLYFTEKLQHLLLRFCHVFFLLRCEC